MESSWGEPTSGRLQEDGSRREQPMLAVTLRPIACRLPNQRSPSTRARQAAGPPRRAAAVITPAMLRIMNAAAMAAAAVLGPGTRTDAAAAGAAMGGLGPSPVRRRMGEEGSVAPVHTELLLKIATLPGGSRLLSSSAELYHFVHLHFWQRTMRRGSNRLASRSQKDDLASGPRAAAALMQEAGGSRAAAMELIWALRHTAPAYTWLSAAMVLLERHAGLVPPETQLTFTKRALECACAIQQRYPPGALPCATSVHAAKDTLLRMLLHAVGRHGSELAEWCLQRVAPFAFRLQQAAAGGACTKVAALQLHSAETAVAAARAQALARVTAAEHAAAVAGLGRLANEAEGLPEARAAAKAAAAAAQVAAKEADWAASRASKAATDAQRAAREGAAGAAAEAAADAQRAAAGGIAEPKTWRLQDLQLGSWLRGMGLAHNTLLHIYSVRFAREGTGVPLPQAIPPLGPLDGRPVADRGQLFSAAPGVVPASPATAAHGAAWTLLFQEDLTGEWRPRDAAGCIAGAAAGGNLAAAVAMADCMLDVGHAESLAQELGREVLNWLGADVRRLLSAILSGSSAAVGAALNSQLTVPFLHGTAASARNWISWDMLHGMLRTGVVDGSATLPQVLCLAEKHLVWLTSALSLAAAQQYPVPALKPVVQALLTYAPRCHATLTGGLLPLAAVPAWADELAFAVERLGCAPGAFLARAATSLNTATLNRLLQCTTRRDLHELLEQVAASPVGTAVPAQPKAAEVAALLGAAVLCKCQALPAAHARWLIRNASGDATGRTLSRVLSLVLHLVPGPQGQRQAASGGGAGQSEQAQAAGEAAAVLQALMTGGQVQPAHFAASCAVLRAVGHGYEG